MVEEAKADARSEGERLVEAAKAEIEQEVNRAKEGLRAQVAALVIDGAEQVLKDSIDASKHEQMLQQLAAEL
jgi:F-type H+-transporting ATPase subunit b